MKKLAVGIVVLFLIPLALAEVVVFEEYNTNTTLQDNSLSISRTMLIKNVGSAPIIPGELHFKIYEQKGSDQLPVEVTNLKAYDRYNKELTTRQIKARNEVDLVVNVWEPLLPGFYHPIYISYDISFKPKGVFFYEITVPSEETTIPIVKNINTFRVPKKYHITYAPNATLSSSGSYNILRWENSKNMQLEYSLIPFPKLSFKAVNLFWLIVIILLIAPIVWLQVRKAKGHEV